MPWMRVTLSFLVFTLASCILLAQQTKTTPRKKPKSNATSTGQAASPSIMVDRKYDKFRNTTSFNASLFNLTPDNVDLLFLTQCEGDVEMCHVDANDSVALGVYYTLGSANLSDTPVFLIIDGVRLGDNLTGIGLGGVSFHGYVKNGIQHQLYMRIPASLLGKIANARSVEGQVSGQQFKLQQAHFEALKKFAHTLDLL